MKHSLTITPLMLTAFLCGCASAPAEPTAQMRPIENYAYMDCQQLNLELGAVSTWEQHHTDMKTYMEGQASFMKSMLIGGGLVKQLPHCHPARDIGAQRLGQVVGQLRGLFVDGLAVVLDLDGQPARLLIGR